MRFLLNILEHTPDHFLQIAIVLLLLVAAVILFAKEAFPVDTTTLMMVVALVLAGVLPVDEAFKGFSSETILTLAAIFVLTGALQQTGVVDLLASTLRAWAGTRAWLTLLALMLAVGFLSAFINNTTATALFVAPAIALARQLKVGPGEFLMPIAFASILGGTCTLIGTSTNLAVNGYLDTAGLRPFGLFEFTPLGVTLFAAGTAYIVLIGRRLLPKTPVEEFSDEAVIREFLSEIIVTAGSPLIGQPVLLSKVARLGFQVLALRRDGQPLELDNNPEIAGGDVLIVTGRREDLMQVKQMAGIEIRAEVKHASGDRDGAHGVAEVFINPYSELAGQTLRRAAFRQRFGVTVLAINRQGATLASSLSTIPLKVGDVLLVQGGREAIEGLRRRRAITVLEELNPALYRRRRGAFVVGAFTLSLLAGGIGLLPLPVSLLIGALAAVLSGAVTMQEAYQFIEWRILVLIGGMTAFGRAMEVSGAAEFLGAQVTHLAGPLGVGGVLAAYYILAALLTQPLSNAAAALVILPIALNTAAKMGADPHTFAITVMMGTSTALIAPFEPSCLLVYGPGKYRFADFLKVGIGTTVLLAVIALWLIPRMWPPFAAAAR